MALDLHRRVETRRRTLREVSENPVFEGIFKILRHKHDINVRLYS
jgi:hypothetical protein